MIRHGGHLHLGKAAVRDAGAGGDEKAAGQALQLFQVRIFRVQIVQNQKRAGVCDFPQAGKLFTKIPALLGPLAPGTIAQTADIHKAVVSQSAAQSALAGNQENGSIGIPVPGAVGSGQGALADSRHSPEKKTAFCFQNPMNF